MSAPLVSVCIVAFNHEQYIRKCIMSAVAQSSDLNLEILVGDDLSEDRTFVIIESLGRQYQNLIQYFQHKDRLGSGSKNYQFLIRKARGRYIAHLDGDDFWLPGKLAMQLRFMEQHPDCPAVYTNAFAIGEDCEALGVFNNPQPERFDINSLLRRGNFLCHSSMLYRAPMKDALIAMKAPFLDYRMHLSHARYGAIGYLNEISVVYRVRSSGSAIVHANDRVRQNYWEALMNVGNDGVNKESLAHGMAEFARSVLFRAIRIKDLSLFCKWFPVVMGVSPVGRMKMGVLIFGSVFRVGCQEALSRLRCLFFGNRGNILYRR